MESVATIEDAWRSSTIHNPSPKILFLIQDAHTNESAQVSIAKLLEALLSFRTRHLAGEKSPLLKERSLAPSFDGARDDKEGVAIKYIFLEAGDGDASLAFLRNKASIEKRKQVAASYVKRGELRGSECLDIISDRYFILWGVEDKELYQKAMLSYQAIAKDRDKFEDYLKRIKQTIDTLKPRIFHPGLLSFDKKNEKFLKEEISLTGYFEILSSEAQKQNISLGAYPHLAVLKRLKNKENLIDFKKASEEQQNALSTLSSEDLEALEGSRQLLKLGSAERKEDKAFYTLLEERLLASNLQPLTKYAELFKYFGYLKESKKIEPKKLLEEQKLLEEKIYRSLIENQDELNLHKAQEALRVLKDLFNLVLTPDQFHEYAKNPKDYDITRLTGFLNKKIMDLKTQYERALFLESGYEDFISHAQDFYEITYERDKAFVENSLKKMAHEKEAILITGGYHSPNLKSLLKKRNISYISLIPQVLHETNKKRYEKILFERASVIQKTIPQNSTNPLNSVTNHKMDAWVIRQTPDVKVLQNNLDSAYLELKSPSLSNDLVQPKARQAYESRFILAKKKSGARLVASSVIPTGAGGGAEESSTKSGFAIASVRGPVSLVAGARLASKLPPLDDRQYEELKEVFSDLHKLFKIISVKTPTKRYLAIAPDAIKNRGHFYFLTFTSHRLGAAITALSWHFTQDYDLEYFNLEELKVLRDNLDRATIVMDHFLQKGSLNDGEVPKSLAQQVANYRLAEGVLQGFILSAKDKQFLPNQKPKISRINDIFRDASVKLDRIISQSSSAQNGARLSVSSDRRKSPRERLGARLADVSPKPLSGRGSVFYRFEVMNELDSRGEESWDHNFHRSQELVWEHVEKIYEHFNLQDSRDVLDMRGLGRLLNPLMDNLGHLRPGDKMEIQVRIREILDRRWLEIVAEDSGPGFAVPVREAIKYGFTTKPGRGGGGWGLETKNDRFAEMIRWSGVPGYIDYDGDSYESIREKPGTKITVEYLLTPVYPWERKLVETADQFVKVYEDQYGQKPEDDTLALYFGLRPNLRGARLAERQHSVMPSEAIGPSRGSLFYRSLPVRQAGLHSLRSVGMTNVSAARLAKNQEEMDAGSGWMVKPSKVRTTNFPEMFLGEIFTNIPWSAGITFLSVGGWIGINMMPAVLEAGYRPESKKSLSWVNSILRSLTRRSNNSPFFRLLGQAIASYPFFFKNFMTSKLVFSSPRSFHESPDSGKRMVFLIFQDFGRVVKRGMDVGLRQTGVAFKNLLPGFTRLKKFKDDVNGNARRRETKLTGAEIGIAGNEAFFHRKTPLQKEYTPRLHENQAWHSTTVARLTATQVTDRTTSPRERLGARLADVSPKPLSGRGPVLGVVESDRTLGKQGARLAVVDDAKKEAIAQTLLRAGQDLSERFRDEVLYNAHDSAFAPLARTIDYDGFRYVAHGTSYIVFESNDYPNVVFSVPKGLSEMVRFHDHDSTMLKMMILAEILGSNETTVDGFTMVRISKIVPFSPFNGIYVSQKAQIAGLDLDLQVISDLMEFFLSHGLWFSDPATKNIGFINGQPLVVDLGAPLLSTFVGDSVLNSILSDPQKRRIAREIGLRMGWQAPYDRTLDDFLRLALRATGAKLASSAPTAKLVTDSENPTEERSNFPTKNAARLAATQVTSNQNPSAQTVAKILRQDRGGIRAFLLGVYLTHRFSAEDARNRIALGGGAVFHMRVEKNENRIGLSLYHLETTGLSPAPTDVPRSRDRGEGRRVFFIGNVTEAIQSLNRSVSHDRIKVQVMEDQGLASLIKAANIRNEEALPRRNYSLSNGAVEIDFTQLAESFNAAKVSAEEALGITKALFKCIAQESGTFYLSHSDELLFQTLKGFDLVQEISLLRSVRENKGQTLTVRPNGVAIAKLHFDTGEVKTVIQGLKSNEAVTRASGFFNGQVPDFIALRMALEQASFYGSHLDAKGEISGDDTEIIKSLEGSVLLRALRSLSVDGKTLKASKAHKLMRSVSLSREDLRLVLIRPLFQFLNDRVAALRHIAQVDLAA